MELEQVAFDLHSLLTYASEIVTPRANAKALELTVGIDSDVPRFVRADPGRIRQIVLNLLGNAVKFTERGSVRLRACMRMGSNGRALLRVAVTDTGIGIPADRLERLFQSFSQTDASISRRYGGTGLGLAISKKLAERMGGTIGVESDVGQGSTFWFEIPAATATAADADRAGLGADDERVSAALAAIASVGRPLRVLVVEDNATNQLVARSVLAKFDIVPDVAGNGLEAIEAVRRRPYDVVLMDVHMPEMDGLEATKAIRSLSGPVARIPIVALTANAFAADIEQCRAAGMNAHVGKPFRREDLAIAIADAVQGRSRFEAAQRVGEIGDHPLLDWAVVERFKADSGEEMLQLLIDTYLGDAAQKLQQLATLLRAGKSSPDAVRLAHSLKSASAMAGAAAVAAIAARVEAALAGGSAPVTGADVDEMSRAFAGYRAQLTARGLVSHG